ncbi:hypothetical protein V2J09_022776 [Rumex salicifolius]
MDPCPFVRIRVGNLALKLPNPPISSSSSFYYAKIKLSDFPIQIATVPLTPPDPSPAASSPAAACFTLSKQDLDGILFLAKKNKKKPSLSLNIDVYGDCNKEKTSCGFGFGCGNLVGRVFLALELGPDRSASGLMHSGWVPIRGRKPGSELNVSVKSDPDPRFVFEFDSQPECSPQVFQVQGSIKQPVFTCKFGFRNSGDRNLRCSTSTAACWGTDPNHMRQNRRRRGHATGNERKGWTVTIHDLSGSPVAVASMVTPFVPSPGSDRVSRSNPGAWLILRPGDGTWRPWGRLEAWRDNQRSSSTVSHRFEVLSASSDAGVTLSSGPLNPSAKFTIDTAAAYYNSPLTSPNSSFDLTSWSGSGSGSESGSGCCGPQWLYKGFVMSATVGSQKARVEVGAQHVTCTEDAAVFVALAAAADLSVDACRPFSQKLRKELRPPTGDVVV